MINLETPKKIRPLIEQAHQVAMNMLRPISRKYDEAEHEYPKELDMLAAMIDGVSESGATGGAGAAGVRREREARGEDSGNKNGANLASVLSIMEMCWGDVGLLLSMPRQGLGNSAIASVANDEQLERFAGTWAAMAITEPGAGSDSANIQTTATQGRRRVRPQRREDLRHLRRARRQRGRLGDARQDPGSRRDQVVRGQEGQPGHAGGAARAQARHPRLRHRGDHLRGLPGPGRGPPRRPPTSTPSRASPARWRPSTTPGRWWRRWRSAVPGPRST